MARLINKLLILILILSVSTANAGRLIPPFFKFMYENASGATVPANGHILYFYDAGTTAPKATYSNVEETVSNGTSITLSSEGWADNVFGTGAYKIIWKDTSGVTVDEFDDVDADSAGLKQFDTYSPIKTYAIYDIVYYATKYYISLQNSNYNNSPSASSAYWSIFEFTQIFNASKTYVRGDLVRTTIGTEATLYTSLGGGSGNNLTDPDEWENISNPVFSLNATYDVGRIVRESSSSNNFFIALQSTPPVAKALTDKDYWEPLSIGKYVFNDIDNTDSPYTTNGWTCEALSINTTSGSCTVNAHSSPSKDDTIVIDDALKQFAGNNVIFASAGSETVDAAASPYTCSTAGARYEFIYDSTNDNWRVIISN